MKKFFRKKSTTVAKQAIKNQVTAKKLTASQMVAIKGGSHGVSTFDLVL